MKAVVRVAIFLVAVAVVATQPRFPPSDLSKESILQSHSSLDEGKKRFDGTSLVFVTPWDRGGYSLAESLSEKFNIVVPVWFVLMGDADHKICRIAGLDLMDLQLVKNLQKDSVKVTPRFIFGRWSAEDVKGILESET